MKGLVLVNGIYKININYKGRQRRCSTRTGHRATAERVKTLMHARRHQLVTGQVTLPPGADPWDFIFEGVTEAPATGSVVAPVNLDDFQADYVASLGPPRISVVFAETQAIYLRHFARFRTTNPDLPKEVKGWQPTHIERYRMWRLSPKGRNHNKQKVRVLTVKKEVQSIRKMFDAARRQGLIELNPVRDLEHIPDDAPDPTFRTYDEIVALETAGNLSEDESRELRGKWLLSVLEVEEIKALMWRSAFTHFMERPGDLALAMHIAGDVGLRIGEVWKLTTFDVSLDLEKMEGVITARSRKQSRKVKETARHLDFNGELVLRLADWIKGLSGRRLFHECKENSFRRQVYRALDAVSPHGTKFFGFRPHLFRHALRTSMYEAGVDEKVIDAYLGHTTREMGDHYRHIRAKRLAEGAKAYAQARARAAAAVAGADPAQPEGVPQPAEGGPAPVFRYSLHG